MRRLTVVALLISLLVSLPAGSATAVAAPRQGVTNPGMVTEIGSGATDGPVAATGTQLPPLPEELQQPSIHAQMLADHEDDPVAFEPGDEPSLSLEEGLANLSSAGKPGLADGMADGLAAEGGIGSVQATRLPNGLRKEIFGFLPYWMVNESALSSMNYQLVSSIAYFSVNVKADGSLAKGTSTSPSSGWAGWNSSAMTQVIERAHQHGVRVVLTVTMMSWDSASAGRQAKLLTTPEARRKLVSQIVGAIRNRGADGVNLDFEPLATSLRDEYASFVRQLKRGLENAGVGDYLTVCVMAGSATWATGYDIPALTADGAADALFVMGYDYHWSGSSRAGGVAPIDSPYTIDVAGTMADFLTQTSGSKLIWGVPYYGRTWPTETKVLNARTLGHGSKAYTYTGHLSQAGRYGRRWDDVGKVPWYRYWDGAAGNWVQGYYDDVDSLGVKYDLVNSRGLAGTGMWTLLMDQGRDELWRLLARKFVNDNAPPVGGIRNLSPRTDGQVFRVRWRAIDYASGVARYSVQWRRPGGPWRAWQTNTKARAAWFAGSAGSTYEFRFRSVDLKGNVSAWTRLPARPSSLSPNAFGRVIAATLNIRSGPGTAYGIVDQAVQGDIVYVLDGPVSANGYQWYRVEYGFSEHPSADYPRIAWMAGSTSGEEYLEPSAAPSRTVLQPFVRVDDVTATFSPNGDGVLDTATIDFDLDGAASAVRLDILDGNGTVIDSQTLGARPAGASSASWDGRIGGGGFAPDGRYLARITATDSGGDTHTGPGPGFNRAAITTWGLTLDRTAPSVDASPAQGAEMVATPATLSIHFGEPVNGLSAANVGLWQGATRLPAAVSADAARTTLTLRPGELLPPGAELEVRLGGSVRDAAGNPPASTQWTFWTAPGTGYRPARDATLNGGKHNAYDIAQDGDLLRRRHSTLRSTGSYDVVQRAVVPNLPGGWILLASGPFEGHWLRESRSQHLDGTAARTHYGIVRRVALRAGTHVGHRFRSDGHPWQSRTVRLRSGIQADAVDRAIINGVPYWRLSSGPLDGFWVAESRTAHQRGRVDARTFAALPRVNVDAGRHTAYGYTGSGRRVEAVVLDLPEHAWIRASGWAVVNGVPHYRVSGGVWDGLWLPESDATRLDV
jgi:spore germination protein YaaH